MSEILQRFFIAILPPPEVTAAARKLQEDFSITYNTKAALRSPPHITLHMPFNWKESKEGDLKSRLAQFFAAITPFKVSIDGFGAFPPRVIFMNVVASKELIQAQQELSRYCRLNLGLFNANPHDQPYHPHLTLAFRDLKKPAFKLAWEERKDSSYTAKFDVITAWLLRHDGREWHPYVAFQLGG
jgi:2'-5' RNA ligase